ncbi:hypothetical protein SK128_009383 [Halocaridina rubra]|uniref:Major facilitator superfamily (MFS) profile domain-containing protein n=1 Tax=Halocaridina rubra TaxID=373956 RepID=A0AAN9A336_HALRR
MTEEEEAKCKKTSHSTLRQIAIAAIIAAARINNGLVIGWPSKLPKIQSEEDGLPISEEDIAWLASMMGLVYIVACFITGPLDELLGPKRLLNLVLIPLPACWLLQAFTPNVSFLYVGRGLSALCGAMIATLVSPLLAELCDTKHRGMVSTLAEIMLDIGLLTSYSLAKSLPWRLATALCAVPFVILILLTPFVPESPYWLVEKNKVKEAERALLRLRGAKASVSEELNAITSTMVQRNPSLYEQISKLKRARYAQPVILVTVIFMLREIGGPNVIFLYSVYMFTRTGVKLDAFTCSILIGIVRFTFTIIAAIVLDRVGRRPILQYSSLACAGAATIAGAVLIGDLEGSSWIPLAAVLLFVAAYGLGLGPVPWVLIGELLPTPVRALGASLVTSFGYLMLFIMNFVFPLVIKRIGLGWTLIFFALANLVLTMVVWAHLPETNNKTLQELETIFCKEHMEASCKQCTDDSTTPSQSNFSIPAIRIQESDDDWASVQIKNGQVIAFYSNNAYEKSEEEKV